MEFPPQFLFSSATVQWVRSAKYFFSQVSRGGTGGKSKLEGWRSKQEKTMASFLGARGAAAPNLYRTSGKVKSGRKGSRASGWATPASVCGTGHARDDAVIFLVLQASAAPDPRTRTPRTPLPTSFPDRPRIPQVVVVEYYHSATSEPQPYAGASRQPNRRRGRKHGPSASRRPGAARARRCPCARLGP